MDALESVLSKTAKRVVEDNVQKYVYDAYTPQGLFPYERTNELLQSVTIDNLRIGTKRASFEVFMDSAKIHPYSNDEGGWSQHESMTTGDDVSDYIPMWVEDGTKPSLWKHPFPAGRPARHYMEKSKLELHLKMFNQLASELRKQGWDVRIL